MSDAAPPRRFLFLLGSGRRDGNTEALARRAAAALPASDAQHWLRLIDLPLAPFHDVRHAGERFPEPDGHARTLVEATLAATDVVVAAPVYWYSLPAATKLYLDYWSAWMRVPGLDFTARMAGKNLWAVSVLSDEDTANAAPFVRTLELSAEYMTMRWRGALLGYGSRPGDVDRDATALEAADRFFGI